MLQIMFLLKYTLNGICYNNESMTILEKVTKEKLEDEFIIPASVEQIVSGSVTNSAFYECRAGIKNVTFPEGSKLCTCGEYLFSKTTVNRVDMSNCLLLIELPTALFFNCTSLTQLILPPNLEVIGYAAICNTLIESIVIPDSVTTKITMMV